MAPCKPMNMIFFVLAPKRGRAPCKHSKHIQKHIPLPLLRNYRGPRFGNQMLELIVVRESLLPEKFSYTNVKTNCCRRTIRRCWNQVLSEKFWYASVETNCQRLPNPDTPMLRPINGCQRTSDAQVLRPIVVGGLLSPFWQIYLCQTRLMPLVAICCSRFASSIR